MNEGQMHMKIKIQLGIAICFLTRLTSDKKRFIVVIWRLSRKCVRPNNVDKDAHSKTRTNKKQAKQNHINNESNFAKGNNKILILNG